MRGIKAVAIALLLCITAVLIAQSPSRSPRSTVKVLLSAVESRDFDAAASTMDLRDVPSGERTEFVKVAAQVLSAVLKSNLIDESGVPDNPSQSKIIIARLKPNPTLPAIELELVEMPDKSWKFSRETLSHVDDLQEIVQIHPEGTPGTISPAEDTPSDPATGASGSVSKSASDLVSQAMGLKPPAPSQTTASDSEVGYGSPRETFNTYLKAMNEDNSAVAVAALDLSKINLVDRETKGYRLANLLLAILNRTEYVDVDSLPSEAESPWTYWTYRNKETGEIVGEIKMVKIGDEWKFSSETLAQLPAIWNLTKDRPVIPGLNDVSELKFDPAFWVKSRVPLEWLKSFLGLELWQWYFMLFFLLGGAIFLNVVRYSIIALLRRKREVANEELAHRTALIIGRSASWMLTFGVWTVGLQILGLPDIVRIPSQLIITLGFYFCLGWFLCAIAERLINFAAARAAKVSERGQRLVAPVAVKLTRALIIVVLLIFALGTFGVNVTAIVAGLGIGGLVVALAAKDSVENLFGSFTMLIEMPFGIGDWVKIGDVEGTVEEISLRSTRVRTFSDSVITLPNKNLITAAIENMGVRRRRQFRVLIRISPSTRSEKIQQFCAKVQESLVDSPGIENGSSYCYLFDFTDTMLTVLLSCYIVAGSYEDELRIRQDILNDALKAAEELEIEIAAPARLPVIAVAKPAKGSLPDPSNENDNA